MSPASVERIECVVVGAGVIGLAIARSLARAGREVVLLEALSAIGSVTSARNSEVIHAGLYSPPDWLKTQACIRGRHALYAYCTERGVAHRRCGKLVVATRDEDIAALHRLQAQAEANGVEDLQLIDGAVARRLEPALQAVAALQSGATGIIDSHGLMLALLGDAEDHGAMLALQSPLLAAHVTPEGFELEVGGAQPMRVHARCLVNAAGLSASAVASRIDGLAVCHAPSTQRCKGNYFSLNLGRAPFTRLIYPLAEAAGLGVHLTLDLAGQARFGPDVQWLDDDDEEIDYTVDPSRAERFAASVRRFWPSLPDGALQPAFSGVRPKLQAQGEPARDFRIDGPSVHGVPGLVNLFGIESPGLTSSLAIGDHVAALL